MGFWAHMLWQRHNLRPEEFDAMSIKRKMFYIASEQLESESPCRLDVFRRKKVGGK